MRFAVPVLIVAAAAVLAVPDYQTPFRVSAEGDPIQLDIGHANPLVVDWNGDGLKDLIVGQYSGGKLRYYQNEDSNDSPMFGYYTYMQADGVDIAVSYG
jgi:hypothetical protein